MLDSLHIRSFWSGLNRLTKLAIEFAAVAVALTSLIIIALRYWLLPGIEQYHVNITASLSKAIGHPVTIGRIEGDWDGWWPRLGFTDVRILDGEGQPALILGSVDARVSWMSLPTADLRLANLDIARPELLVRRGVRGNLYIGNATFARKGGDSTLADWLLRQSRLAVHDALIVWVDELRDAPPLVLEHVNLQIENLFDRHRFALRATPPQELATPLDVRGDFDGESFGELGSWRGRLFTQLDYTNVTDWRPWLELPKEFNRGRGAIRGWLGIEQGKLAEVVADLELRDVVTRLAADLPEMALLRLSGRAAWKVSRGGLEVSAHQLEMQSRDGIGLQPTDFYFRSTPADGEQPAGGEMRANLLQLAPLAGLVKFLPLDAGLRERIAAYAPDGQVSNLDFQWQGALERPDSFRVKGQFENLALRQAGGLPGFFGLSLDVDGSNESGRLNIVTRRLTVEAPGVMREPLFFDILTAQAGWKREQGELAISVNNGYVANNDLAGSVFGSYRTQAGTRGVLDLTANLTRGDIRSAARYTPLIGLHQHGNDWLNGALLAGHTEDFSVRIKGNLSDFPLRENSNALLMIGGRARDAVLEFAKDWPRIENIDGEFWIRGNRMEVRAATATMAGAELRNVTVALPDMTARDLALEINGDASASNETLLQFVQQSPVRGYINGFTDGMKASGNGHLTLFTRIPLNGGGKAQVSGQLRVQGSDIELGEGRPSLRNTRGMLSFTESGMQASGILTEILGGPASADIRSGEGIVHISAQGRSNFDALRRRATHPVLDYLRGGANWQANIKVANREAQIAISSDLKGMTSALPQPFAKDAAVVWPLRIETTASADGQGKLAANLGDWLAARLELNRDQGGNTLVRRGAVHFGKQPASAARKRTTEGVWLTGDVPVLSVQGWGGLLGAASSGSAVPLAGIKLSAGKLTGYGQTAGAVRINASQQSDRLTVKLDGDALKGEVTWQPHGYKGSGKLGARLRKLHLAPDSQDAPQATGSKDGPDDASPGALPALEIAVESLQIKGNPAGRFELVGHPDARDWRLRRLNIANPDGSLSGDGVWHSMKTGTQTEVNLQLALIDAGKTLARSGYPGTVKGGSGKLAASLSWKGAPDKFKVAALNGTLKLDTGKGRFLKMDPGAGKLLSILSLQALPKRVALDFDDVFTTGFEFDRIKGDATIRDGVIDTQNLAIDGSAAKITMKGSVDLNKETQNLRVRVLPAVGAGVSLGVAFAAGPAVGIGALIVNKVLGDPLDKLVSFEYNIDGTWDNPNVVKIQRPPAKLPE